MDMMKRVWQDEPEYMDHPEIPPWFDDECEEFFKLIPVIDPDNDKPHAVDNGDGTASFKGKLTGMGL